MRMINVISLGAGKQSTYMLLRGLEGTYKYRPDYAVFSDTGCEPQYVYDHLEWLINYVKCRYNFNINVVSAGNLQKDIEDYIDGKCSRASQIPLRLEGEGLIMRQCTNDYKIAPLRRFLQDIRQGERIRLWIGISLDEIERMKVSNVKYIENYYPLVFSQIRIDAIKEWFKKNGLPEPGKSACKICPFHSDQYWKRFKKFSPKEFDEVCQFDRKIRNYPKLNKKAYLSRHLKPLFAINFTYGNSLFPELIEECEGLCGL